MHKIWSVDFTENLRNCCYQLPSFKTKMHQVRFHELHDGSRVRFKQNYGHPRLTASIAVCPADFCV